MIERTVNEGIVTLRLAHGKACALDTELCEALSRELTKLRDADAIVLTGTGSIFSAGVDLFRILREGEEYVREFLPALDALVRTLFTHPRPVVAGINGHAIAGGCILAGACDHRLLARSGARIGVPELLVGVPFPPMALEVMRFAVGPHRVQEVVYSGATFEGDEAVSRGLADALADRDSLLGRAAEKARELGEIPRTAFRLTKEQLRNSALRRADSYAGRHWDEAVGHWASADARQRIERYMERTVRKK